MAGLEDIFEDKLDEHRIIKCINNLDFVGLKSLFLTTNLDVTKITDENGFTLIHLAVYINSEKCLNLMIEHFRERQNNYSNYSSDGSEDEEYKKGPSRPVYDLARLKTWVNTATLLQKEEIKEV